ncbi:TPA: helix-turn-helix transcriptional regulator [Yersinia enterocolitica]|jgi:transcriptional regulator with XRE-family HTH domain|nr:helix-turn-helix transcriptional regulator [Yersinia enterocolitica]HDL6908984.1 helix-turn-helix transcriptional regulator [Yersinia enterocolitica]HDL7027362.1 helix-turn-helix transcriptional regulator [Yersinia enterocolitica]HDL7036112.1 helix-turn-helix transcriptional regulator [Yersinia enterocolitica]HDL7200809.1 helix-turn-helix transcriptional regulator [Yersinia enterocolitica]
MNTTEHTQQPRLLTPAELAACIRLFREMRQWSQEQLAAISGLNVRTIQRVEQGLSASLDTRRALARAFEFEDIDVLNKPFAIPCEEEAKAAKEKFDREHVTLTAIPLTTGKQLAKLAETCSMDLSEPAFELTREADETFAMLVDYLRDYRDCADAYSETQKVDVYDEMQSHIDALKALGVSLRYATRKIQVKWGTDADVRPMPATVLYVIGFPLGKEPEQFATPKSAGIRL